jgi:hypothetical protein
MIASSTVAQPKAEVFHRISTHFLIVRTSHVFLN